MSFFNSGNATPDVKLFLFLGKAIKSKDSIFSKFFLFFKKIYSR